MSNTRDTIFKLFEELYGINLSIAANNLMRFNMSKPELENLLTMIINRKNEESDSFAITVFNLYTKAIIIQNKLLKIQRTILKSKASPLEWEDKQLSILNDAYRKIKNANDNLSQIIQLFSKTGEIVPYEDIEKINSYICEKKYSSSKYDLINALKAFNSGNLADPTCPATPYFNDKLSWAEKMFTHRYRTIPLTQKELPIVSNHIQLEIDNTDSPLIYTSSNTKNEKKIAVNQVQYYLNEAQRYANYQLTHKYDLSPKDRLAGYNLKLQLEDMINKETEHSIEKMFAGITIKDAKNPLRFIKISQPRTAKTPCSTCITRKEGKIQTYYVVVKMADNSKHLVCDLHGNTNWQDIEYIPNYIGIRTEITRSVQPLHDLGFKFNKYYGTWQIFNEEHEYIPKELEMKNISKSIIKSSTEELKTIYKSLPNRLLKSNFRGQVYSIAKLIEPYNVKTPKKDINTLYELIKWYRSIIRT